MENFEDAIKDFVVKKVEKDGTVVFVLANKYRKTTVTLERAVELQKQPKTTKKKIIYSPDGLKFTSVGEAAKHYGLPWAKVKYRIITEKDGWRLEDEET